MTWDSWRDYSGTHGWTGWDRVITVPNSHGFYITAFLSTLVTIAGASAWNIVSLFLHASLARRGPTSDIFGLQQQVLLRNPGSPFRAAIDALMVHWSWGKVPVTRRLRRTAAIAVPGVIVWALFTVSSIMVSKVATDPDQPVMVRLRTDRLDRCGYLSNSADIQGAGAGIEGTRLSELRADKTTNDTIDARAYALSVRPDMARNGEANSIYFKRKLGYTLDTEADCIFPDASYCRDWKGVATTISFTSDKLNSHLDLGINASPKSRVVLQQRSTCSLVNETRVFDNSTEGFYQYHLGPVGDITETGPTLSYPTGWWNSTIGYWVKAHYATLGYSNGSHIWRPTEGIARTDADLGIIFLASNGVRYSSQVKDPWFYAPYAPPRSLYRSKLPVSVMVCADQYRWCNPADADGDNCTAYGAAVALSNAASGEEAILGFNAAQMATAWRLSGNPKIFPTIMDSPADLGPAALFASRKIRFNRQSSGLKETQWHDEVAGWFETVLADHQATTYEWVQKNSNLDAFQVYSPFVEPERHSPLFNFTKHDTEARLAALKDQCYNQIVVDSGKMQNFSVAGLVIVIVISILLILLGSWISEILDVCSDLRVWYRHRSNEGLAQPVSSTKIARQADERLHLLRYALDGAGMVEHSGLSKTWHEVKVAGVPVLTSLEGLDEDLRRQDFTVYRPTAAEGDGDLFEYPKHPFGMGTDALLQSTRTSMVQTSHFQIHQPSQPLESESDGTMSPPSDEDAQPLLSPTERRSRRTRTNGTW